MIEPFKGLLLGVFFVSVGMGLDVSRLAASPLAILACAAGLVAMKAAIVISLSRGFRLSRPVAAEAGLLLGPGGEFAFVILGGAMAGGLVPDAIGQACLILATVTMIAIPFLARAGARFSKRLERAAIAEADVEPPPPAPAQGRVIVAGYGRVGQLVGEMLAHHDVPYLAIDADPARVAEQRRLGKPVYFGDSASPELLRRCTVANARALVVTLDSPNAIGAVVAAARAERPDLTIVARARDARHATALYELGVDDAVPETIEASLQLSEAVLVDIGVPMGLVIASIHERRDKFRAALKKKDARAGGRAREFKARRTIGKRAP
jgi:CPA2 family monovalent cation:H+ antiporter-2